MRSAGTHVGVTTYTALHDSMTLSARVSSKCAEGGEVAKLTFSVRPVRLWRRSSSSEEAAEEVVDRPKGVSWWLWWPACRRVRPGG